MRTPASKAVAAHRQRLKRKGLVRIEVQAPKEDAFLLRAVAGALADPAQAQKTRALLREYFPGDAAPNLKALLASAPLDLDLDFERPLDPAPAFEW